MIAGGQAPARIGALRGVGEPAAERRHRRPEDRSGAPRNRRATMGGSGVPWARPPVLDLPAPPDAPRGDGVQAVRRHPPSAARPRGGARRLHVAGVVDGPAHDLGLAPSQRQRWLKRCALAAARAPASASAVRHGRCRCSRPPGQIAPCPGPRDAAQLAPPARRYRTSLSLRPTPRRSRLDAAAQTARPSSPAGHRCVRAPARALEPGFTEAPTPAIVDAEGDPARRTPVPRR